MADPRPPGDDELARLADEAAAPRPLILFDATPGVAGLSIALFVAICTYPPPRGYLASGRVWSAFIALLEARGHAVWLAPHPMLKIRRIDWTMTPARRDQILSATAYRLLSRRLAAIRLGFLMAHRPAGRTLDDVLAAHGGVIAAGRRVAGRYVPKQEVFEADPANVHRLVWRESRPVLHLAYVVQQELDRAHLNVWDWPALALMEGQQERIRRMVTSAEIWRRALQQPTLGARDATGTVPDAVQLRVLL